MTTQKELASAQLLSGGGGGLRTNIKLEKGVDRRVLLMLAHDLLTALEQAGFLTQNIAQAKPLMRGQLEAWGMAPGPLAPPPATNADTGGPNIAV